MGLFKNFKFDFKYIMAFASLSSCFLILVFLANWAIPEHNKDMFNMLSAMFFQSTIGKAMRALFPDKEDIKKQPTT